jgi:hypothetical protein
MRMARRWRIRLLISAVALPLLVWGFDRVQTIYWVGSTDLEVEFAITDAATGRSVPGAWVEVQSEGGFYEERDKQEFALVSGADGVARKECRDSMCFGTRSGLRFTDTFVVHLPWWRYRVVAEAYHPTAWANLDVLELRRQVRRAGPGKASLVVPVSLHKRPVEPGAAVKPQGQSGVAEREELPPPRAAKHRVRWLGGWQVRWFSRQA